MIARIVFAAVAWLFVALVAVQVFLAGVGLFGAGNMDGHREFGWLLSMLPLLVVIAAAAARAGRLALWSGGLFVLAIVQTFLPTLKADAPFVAALHPVNALAIAWLGYVIAQRATALAREPRRTEASLPQTARS